MAALNLNGHFTTEDYSSSTDGDDDDDAGDISSSTPVEASILDQRDRLTADNWVERSSSMVRLTGKHPFNAEPPLERLMHHGFITPVPLHYVRNHGAVPKASWEDWTVQVAGLVASPTSFTMHRLVTEFRSKEFPVTLVCAGNRRKEQNMVKQTIGFNWGAAGVSTSVWRGVPLRAVLKRCGIVSRKKGALYVCFEGAEDLPGGGGSKYGTSLARAVAMDPSRDVILAYLQNGERLKPDHGFPVRIIIPGFIGGRMVKWLKRIIVTTTQSDSHYHYMDNRVLPSHVADSQLANAQGWWYRPEYIINELNINSVITSPHHGEEIIPANQRAYTLRGYAYSGGGRKVTRVELTMDGGDTWRLCMLDTPEKPNKYGKYWCWCFWAAEVDTGDLLEAEEIAVRAWDESLNTQPEILAWNLMGMMNNCWFRVKTKLGAGGMIVFLHPTLPGNQPGGWMGEETSAAADTNSTRRIAFKKTVSSRAIINTSAVKKSFSAAEVEKHNSADSAWIIVHGRVYDCTRFLRQHPGGADSILINAGTDCTEEFDAIHSHNAQNMIQDYIIGHLSDTDTALSSSRGRDGTTGLVTGERIRCRLVAKTSLTRDVRLFRFELPNAEHVLGLPVGKHILLCATIDGKLCMRAYTPTSGVEAVGYFELVVKIYLRDVHPKFPKGGLMSQHLDSLELGSLVDVKGPMGHIEYAGRGNFLVHGKRKSAKKVGMIAGGTGITPIYQVIQAILKDPEDRTEMYLVYANRTEDDILLRNELDGWAAAYPGRIKIWYLVRESVREGWKYSLGFIDDGVLREHIPAPAEDTLALGCGPPPMLESAVKPNLEKIGFDIDKSLLVF